MSDNDKKAKELIEEMLEVKNVGIVKFVKGNFEFIFPQLILLTFFLFVAGYLFITGLYYAEFIYQERFFAPLGIIVFVCGLSVFTWNIRDLKLFKDDEKQLKWIMFSLKEEKNYISLLEKILSQLHKEYHKERFNKKVELVHEIVFSTRYHEENKIYLYTNDSNFINKSYEINLDLPNLKKIKKFSIIFL